MLVIKLGNEQDFLDLLSTIETDSQWFHVSEFSIDSWQQCFNFKLDKDINKNGQRKFIKFPTKSPKIYPCILIVNHYHGKRMKHEYIYSTDFETKETKIMLEHF